MAYRANAKRAKGDLLAAGDILRNARGLIRNQGVTDPVVYAEVDWIEGALRKDQRQFKEAEELLVRAVNLYGLTGPKEKSAPPLITLGLLYYDRGDPQKATEVTRAAAGMINPKADPRFYLCARHNLALFLAESGDYRVAAETLHQDAELYREFPDLWTNLRQTWLKGKIAWGLGNLDEAERLLGEARNGFTLQNISYDASKVSVDLMRIYEQQGSHRPRALPWAEGARAFGPEERRREEKLGGQRPKGRLSSARATPWVRGGSFIRGGLKGRAMFCGDGSSGAGATV